MHWTLDPIGGSWIATAVVVALLMLPWLVAPRDATLTPRRRQTLLALRTTATLLLMIAWVRPTIVRVSVETLRPTLLILIDSSRSMSVEDALDGDSRWGSVRRLLDASDAELRRLSKTQDVRAFRFDREVTPLSIDDQGRIGLPSSPDGRETTIGASLEEVFNQEADALLSGVVLLSDGAQRATSPRDAAPLSVVQRISAEGTPVFAVAVGERASGDQPDIAIEDLLVSDTAFASAPLDANATLRVTGFPNQPVRVRLLWENARGGMETVDANRIEVRPGIGEYPMTFRHTPSEPGEWKLTVEAETLEGETLRGNNRTSTFVTVREGGIRVLYLVGATRVRGSPWIEQRFIRQSLAESPDLSVERVVFDYRRLRADLSERLASGDVDVFIVDNLDSEALNRASWQSLAELVQRGAGLAMIGGKQSFGAGGHAMTPMADVLPVVMGRAERQPLDQALRTDLHLEGPLKMRPSLARGVRHPLLDLGESSSEVWQRLPELDGANLLSRDRLKPNAVVLAEADDQRDARPLLVIGQPGLGRAIAFAADSTFRWFLAGEREAHRRFWRQVVLWLAKKEDTSGAAVYVELGARRVAPGARVDFASGVRGIEAAGGPIQYDASVVLPDGQQAPLSLPLGGDRVTGVFTNTRLAGDYRVTVRASQDGQLLGQAESRFLVPEQDLELERPGAEPEALARLARATEASGGRALALEELPGFLAELASQPPTQKQEITSKTTLWDKWPLLIALVGLMSTEWWLRRQWGMP